MAVYEIQNYVKLLCIRLDHFESYVVDEKNTTSADEIEKFIKLHEYRQGVKILIFQMNTMEMITFEEVKKIIHTAHAFDYIRSLVNSGNKLLQEEDISGVSAELIKYLLDVK